MYSPLASVRVQQLLGHLVAVGRGVPVRGASGRVCGHRVGAVLHEQPPVQLGHRRQLGPGLQPRLQRGVFAPGPSPHDARVHAIVTRGHVGQGVIRLSIGVREFEAKDLRIWACMCVCIGRSLAMRISLGSHTMFGLRVAYICT